jgi:hypothetical protein
LPATINQWRDDSARLIDGILTPCRISPAEGAQNISGDVFNKIDEPDSSFSLPSTLTSRSKRRTFRVQ